MVENKGKIYSKLKIDKKLISNYTRYPEALLFCCFYLFTPLYSVKYGTFLFLSKYNPSTVDYIEKQ